MPLQSGIWTLNVGGNVTQLSININNDATGFLAKIGSLPFIAFWDEDSQRLILSARAQLFVGYLFTDTLNLTGVKGAVLFTLVGSAESYQPGPTIGPPATATRSTCGWYAQIGVD